ncbi:MAG: flagellar basal body protein FliL [Chromatiaceae bacterium]|nr:MAG: flagellar basal body protein FliL [Chromatiaceae bacterium]
MAKKPEKSKLDLNPNAGKGSGKGGALKLILIVLVTFVVAAAVGGAAAWYFLVMPGDRPAEERTVLAEPLYLPLEPPLVVNFSGSERIRFAQVGIVVMARNEDVFTGVERHMPVIRNNLMLLLSQKTYDQLVTPEGKEVLRAEVLDEIRGVLEQRGAPANVEAIYFNNLVMQ